jgi:predicted dehydrogenase
MSFLVVGGGKMGLSHLAILNRLLPPQQVSLCDPSRLARFVFSRLGIQTFPSVEAALAQPVAWSGAIVATPTGTHHGVAQTLLERGIACFVEKPLTLDPERSAALLALQQRKAVVGQMGLVLRFVQPFVRLRQVLHSGMLGKPVSYQARMLGNVVTKPDNGSWRTDFKRGGGCLNEYGPHLIDLCRAFFGEVGNLHQVAFGCVHSTNADDSIDLGWTHANGVPGQLRLDWCDTTRRKSYTDFDVQFERGSVHANIAEIRIEPAPDAPLTAEQRAWIAAPVLPYPVNFYLRGEEFTLQLEVFIERVTGKRLLRADIDREIAADLSDGEAVDRLIRDIAHLGGLA